jgi:putative ABC transport system permease protein
VIGLVVRQALRLTLIGIGAGLVIGMLATRVLARQLYGVSALDPWVYAAVPLLWIAVALLASWLPARRATQVQPQIALRYD